MNKHEAISQAVSKAISRRLFLGQGAGVALGSIALNVLERKSQTMATEIGAGQSPLPDLPAKAKRVIFLTQSGGPSQIELYDHKPGLDALAGSELPDSVRNGQRLTGMTAGKKQLVMPPHSKFTQHGESRAIGCRTSPRLLTICASLSR